MVHGLLSFLSDVYGLLDPSGKSEYQLLLTKASDTGRNVKLVVFDELTNN